MRKNSRFISVFVVVGISLASLGGCHYKPHWGPQGTIGEQRNRALLHDPFPDNDLGPAIMGGRPRGFDQPRSEATNLQDNPYAQRSQRGGLFRPRNGF